MCKWCCSVCKKGVLMFEEYTQGAAEENMTPYEYVAIHEPSFNKKTTRFICTECLLRERFGIE